MIQNNFIWACLRWWVKDDSMLSVFFSDALRRGSAVGWEMDQPMIKSQDVAILLFLVLRLCGDFRELKKCLLVPFPEDHVLIFVIFLKIDVWRASLINDLINVRAIDVVNIWWYLFNDCISISGFTNVLALQVSNNHAHVQAVVDGAGSCQVNSLLGNFGLIGVVKSR